MSNKKSHLNVFHIILYVVGGFIGLALLYMLLTKVSGSSQSGDYKTKGMHLVAAIMTLIIVYLFLSNIINEYESTMNGEPWLVETTKNAQQISSTIMHIC